MVRIAPPPLLGQWMLLRNTSAADPVPAASSIREPQGAAGRDGEGEDSDGESRYLALLLGGKSVLVDPLLSRTPVAYASLSFSTLSRCRLNQASSASYCSAIVRLSAASGPVALIAAYIIRLSARNAFDVSDERQDLIRLLSLAELVSKRHTTT